MVYEGKHAKREAAAGNHDGAYGPDDDHTAPRQPGEAMPMPDVTLDSLEEEESQDGDGSYERMQHLLGSIYLQGIRLQSPIYFADPQRLKTTSVQETSSADHQDAAPPQENDAAPQEDDMLRDDTVILVAIDRPPRDGNP